MTRLAPSTRSRSVDSRISGDAARDYASYIAHHLDGIAGGATYADLSAPERDAKAAVQAAKDAGAPAAEVADLQAKASGITGQRDTLFNVNGRIDESHRGQYQTDVLGRFARSLVRKYHLAGETGWSTTAAWSEPRKR